MAITNKAKVPPFSPALALADAPRSKITFDGSSKPSRKKGKVEVTYNDFLKYYSDIDKVIERDQSPELQKLVL